MGNIHQTSIEQFEDGRGRKGVRATNQEGNSVQISYIEDDREYCFMTNEAGEKRYETFPSRPIFKEDDAREFAETRLREMI